MKSVLKLLVVCLVSVLVTTVFAVDSDRVIGTEWEALPLLSAKNAPDPDKSPSKWGKWKFINEPGWTRYYMFKPDSSSGRWSPPLVDYNEKDWRKYHGAWMRTRKLVPEKWKGEYVYFTLDGNGCKSVKLFINRDEVATISTVTAKIDVSKYLKYGSFNEFRLLLDGGDDCEFMLRKDSPCLIPKSASSVDGLFVNTSWRTHTLTVETEVSTEKPAAAVIEAHVLDAEGNEVKLLRGAYDIPAGTTILKPSVKWEDPVLWELGRGYLYTLKTTVSIGKKKFACRDIKFGFREVWREGGRFFMNGRERKFRVSRDFGCNRFGAKLLTKAGFDVIHFGPRPDPEYDAVAESDAQLLEYLSTNGIGAIWPISDITKNDIDSICRSKDRREECIETHDEAIRLVRNWPCIIMAYMGADVYSPPCANDPARLGDEDDSEFPKTVAEFIEAAKLLNPNIVYYSFSDCVAGDMAAATFRFNWEPICEWEDCLSHWVEKGGTPLQIRGMRLPREEDWFRNGRACVTELLAAYYGDRAYELEPDSISRNHRMGEGIQCFRHPLVREFYQDFVSRVNRAWDAMGVNGGVMWADFDVGYGMPASSAQVLEAKQKTAQLAKKPGAMVYPVPKYDFLKSEAEIPNGKPDWAYPTWDIHRECNEGLVCWIAGCPRVSDRRHAYVSGEKVEKKCVISWKGTEKREFYVKWTASMETKKGSRKVASGGFRHKLDAGATGIDVISFDAPAVKNQARLVINAKFFSVEGKQIAADKFVAEVYPQSPALPTKKQLEAAKVQVIPPFTMKSKDDLPWDAIRNGLKVLVLQQSAEVMKSLGFEVEDAVPRQLYLRDRVSPSLAALTDDDLRDWYGQPKTEQAFSCGFESYGNIFSRVGPNLRWNYNNALGGLVLRTPDVVGYLPVIEGGFDGNYSGVVRRYVGKGEVIFSTLSPTDRTGTNELKGGPVSDPAARKTLAALYADLLRPAEPHTRKIFPSGDYARRIAKAVNAVSDDTGIVPNSLIICGPDSDLTDNDVVSAVRRGSNVLIINNPRIAEGLGLKFDAPGKLTTVYRLNCDLNNPDLRSIGLNLLHFRDAYSYVRILGCGKDWRIDIDGMFASRTYREGGKIFVSQFDPFQIEDHLCKPVETKYYVPKFKSRKADDSENRVVDETVIRCDLTIEHCHQFIARLLTILGMGSNEGPIYNGRVAALRPYDSDSAPGISLKTDKR